MTSRDPLEPTANYGQLPVGSIPTPLTFGLQFSLILCTLAARSLHGQPVGGQ